MNQAVHNKIVSFIWSIADDCLRDIFVRGKYRDVILPMVVLRRLDNLLEPTKDKVLEELSFQKTDMNLSELDPKGMEAASGYVFYNISKWTLRKLYSSATNSQQILLANVEDYLKGFSANVQEIIDKFNLKAQVRHMAAKDVLLDVLANYTTYKSYYEIQKSIQDNPLFDSKKAQKKLRAFVERHQQTIDIKAQIILEHFIPQVVNTKKLKGLAKGMVITQNIETAIRYYKAIARLLDKKANPFKVAIAFSGSKAVDGVEYTEASINGFGESETRGRFDQDDCRLLVVVNKYLIGFDQPKLTAMYVDKKLQNVMAVQALSRLNRSAPDLGKKTEDLFILDFFNSVEDIKDAFDPFYTATSLSRATDVNVLHELKEALDLVGVYEWQEVEDFVERYFSNADAQSLSPIIDTAAARFNADLSLEEADKADFKIKAKQFVKIYGQMASIMPYEIVIWEKLFWFLKFLIPKPVVKDPDTAKIDELLESIDLSSYGLSRVKLNHHIRLDESESELDPQNPNPRGAHDGEDEKDPLDEIIRNFNERWFQGWSATPEEQRVKFLTIADNIKAHPDFDEKYKNNQDVHNRLLASDMAFKAAMQQSLRQIVDR